MSSLLKKLLKIFVVLPAAAFLVLANVFICLTCAGFVLTQLLSMNVDRSISVGVAGLIAIAIHFYIVFNYKIRNYINSQGETE